MRGAMPSGWSAIRSAFAGGSSRCPATPSSSSATAPLAAARFQARSTTIAGYGSCAASRRSSAAFAGAISGSSSERSP